MKAYGYKINGKRQLKLREATFVCDTTELDKIIEFFQHVKQECDKYSKVKNRNKIYSWQSKDWDSEWEENSINIISEIVFDVK